MGGIVTISPGRLQRWRVQPGALAVWNYHLNILPKQMNNREIDMKKVLATLTLIGSIGMLAACGQDTEVPEPEERPPAATSGTGAAAGTGTATPTGGGTGTATSKAPGSGYDTATGAGVDAE